MKVVNLVKLFTIIQFAVLGEATASENTFLDEKHSNKHLSLRKRDLPEDVEEDANLLAPDLIRKYGYPCEVHYVETEDGYILEIHRIPRYGGRPIFLQHGLLDSSVSWILMGPKQGLGYLLADEGYDVWMGNSRGNRYCRRHAWLEIDTKDFWDFSFHEQGVYDLPATIDFILNQTAYENLDFIGHSQGTTAFWVMMSERPKYNKKIHSIQALAPVAFLDNVRSPFIKYIVKVLGTVTAFTKVFGIKQFLPNHWLMKKGGKLLCQENCISQTLCTNILFLIAGYNPSQLNKTMLPVILSHVPSGASVKQMIHFGQIANSGKFRKYDRGFLLNLYDYSKFTPPEYDLSKVEVPVIIYYSQNDWMVDTGSVKKLYGKLTNAKKRVVFRINDPNFNHFDYVWAINARELLYNQMLEVLQDIEGL